MSVTKRGHRVSCKRRNYKASKAQVTQVEFIFGQKQDLSPKNIRFIYPLHQHPQAPLRLRPLQQNTQSSTNPITVPLSISSIPGNLPRIIALLRLSTPIFNTTTIAYRLATKSMLRNGLSVSDILSRFLASCSMLLFPFELCFCLFCRLILKNWVLVISEEEEYAENMYNESGGRWR